MYATRSITSSVIIILKYQQKSILFTCQAMKSNYSLYTRILTIFIKHSTKSYFHMFIFNETLMRDLLDQNFSLKIATLSHLRYGVLSPWEKRQSNIFNIWSILIRAQNPSVPGIFIIKLIKKTTDRHHHDTVEINLMNNFIIRQFNIKTVSHHGN